MTQKHENTSTRKQKPFKYWRFVNINMLAIACDIDKTRLMNNVKDIHKTLTPNERKDLQNKALKLANEFFKNFFGVELEVKKS